MTKEDSLQLGQEVITDRLTLDVTDANSRRLTHFREKGVITEINAPHLSWGITGRKKKPQQVGDKMVYHRERFPLDGAGRL